MKIKDAEHYIKIFCNYADAEIRNYEIALEAPHTLGKLVDHAGEMPSSSGFLHDVLVGRIDKMRTIHPDFPMSVSLLRRLKEKECYCVLAFGYLIMRRPPESKKIMKTVKDVAEYIEYEYESFKKARQRGIDRMNAQLGVIIA